MTIADKLNELESYYFFERPRDEASPDTYIDGNTWRGFTSDPWTTGAPSRALKKAFTFLTSALQRFLQQKPNLTRPCFDGFHEKQVEALYTFLSPQDAEVVVIARAEGTFHERAYNPYAKVVNLAYTHWCFWPQPRTKRVQCPPLESPQFRSRLHVPLDEKVLGGVKGMIESRLLTSAPLFGFRVEAWEASERDKPIWICKTIFDVRRIKSARQTSLAVWSPR